MLHQRFLKQPLDTKSSFATQHHEAKAPSRDKKDRRRSHKIHTQKRCKIIGFLLVLNTFTISMLFREHQILNGAGATSTFCEITKKSENKMLTAQPPEHDFVKTLNGTAATSDFRILRFFDFQGLIGVQIPIRSATFQKQN